MASQTPAGRVIDINEAIVTLNGAGTGSVVVNFSTTFVGVPQIMVVKAAGAAGTFAASSITESSFSLDVTGDTTRLNQRIKVTWVACEKA